MLKVKLTTGRVGLHDGVPWDQASGSTIELPRAEALALVRAEQAIGVGWSPETLEKKR